METEIAGLYCLLKSKKPQEELGENTLGGLADYRRSLQSVDDRDPRGFIIPSSQADFATATKFINTLIKNGVDVHQAGDDFDIGNHSYPSGSYVVKANQAFRHMSWTCYGSTAPQ